MKVFNVCFEIFVWYLRGRVSISDFAHKFIRYFEAILGSNLEIQIIGALHSIIKFIILFLCLVLSSIRFFKTFTAIHVINTNHAQLIYRYQGNYQDI